MRINRLIALIQVSAWFSLLGAAPSPSAGVDDALKGIHNLSTAQRRSTLEEGARKEAEIIWYTSMGLPDFPKIVGAFEKTFPYVKIRTNRLSQSSLM
jgi:hypothetical protein